MEIEEKYKIRELQQSDRETVTEIIKGVVEQVGDESVVNLISGDVGAIVKGLNKKDKQQNKQREEKRIVDLGIKILTLALNVLNEDLKKWFCDLLGCDADSFAKMPLDIEIKIIHQIANAPEVGSFFSGASQQFKQISELWIGWKNKNKK
jgi:hypothetical protein